VLQSVYEMARPEASSPAMDGIRFIQCRLPVDQYEWLRYRAFRQRSSMNSIVLRAVGSLQETSDDAATPLALAAGSHALSGAKSAGVKFNVRLPDDTYEWLRAKAFYSRGSINQLMIMAIARLSARAELVS